MGSKVIRLTHETKTEGVRADKNLRDHLERNVWPMLTAAEAGRVLTREQEDQILGYGPEGY
jgi:hypothetical protein